VTGGEDVAFGGSLEQEIAGVVAVAVEVGSQAGPVVVHVDAAIAVAGAW
jgi:hypothetical protein